VEEPGTENNFPADVRTKETADLFLVLIKHLLKNQGTLPQRRQKLQQNQAHPHRRV
jgi:hypothetical protein